MIGAAGILLGFLVEAALSWPARLYTKIGHPVSWIGLVIRAIETRLNTADQTPARLRLSGGVGVCMVLTLAVVPAIAVAAVLPEGWAGTAIGGVLAWPFLAPRSLFEHVAAVAKPLAKGDTSAARYAVSMIIGRDPDKLDDAAIARASLESLAENASDGVVAPVFWGVVLGLPGLVGYKAINTMDSMIGHRSVRYRHYGMVAARLDDLVNLIPARLTGLLFVLVSGHMRRAAAVMLRDARHHRSPNAGWPEGAMAGALDVRLSGPRVYGSEIADEPWLNAEGQEADATGLRRGLALYLRAMFVLAVVLALVALI
ncbi:MAG: cobalamin biosynthesis protein CobD [Sulfitobacter litoralis]|uniref:adenosylcobinamide-phosphate synthase CbiB n=1 Tax=Sulfitobacter litoralis TaxID=335975 RepID=UPI001B4BAB04|nr:adenosylcobinamide-phosphate synthase CbiB [Sulfitobacter litoralis]MBQ0764924.1 cobalamin biosynthesis protein CobD [Sulfitobacter litoralis]